MPQYRIGDQLYDMDPTSWNHADLSSAKRALGCGIAKFMEMLDELDPDAIQVLLWILRRRTEPSLRVDGVDFTLQEYIGNVILSDEEMRAAWANTPREGRPTLIGKMDADQKERLLDENGELKGLLPPDPLEASTSATATQTS